MSFGWWRVYEGPMMLRPGTDLRLLKISRHRVCDPCSSKLQLAGVPMAFEGGPDEQHFQCFYCGSLADQTSPTLRLVS